MQHYHGTVRKSSRGPMSLKKLAHFYFIFYFINLNRWDEVSLNRTNEMNILTAESYEISLDDGNSIFNWFITIKMS